MLLSLLRFPLLHHALRYFNVYSMYIQCLSMPIQCPFNVYSMYMCMCIQCFTCYLAYANLPTDSHTQNLEMLLHLKIGSQSTSAVSIRVKSALEVTYTLCDTSLELSAPALLISTQGHKLPPLSVLGLRVVLNS